MSNDEARVPMPKQPKAKGVEADALGGDVLAAKANGAFATADRATLRRAVEQASVPALMMTLMHLEGNTSIMRSGIAPRNVALDANEDGLSETERETIRERAVEAALEWREGGRDLFVPDRETLDRATSFILGQKTPDGYAQMLREELPFAGPNRPAWLDGEVPTEERARFPVIVIGAGMSGLLAGVRLKRTGYPFVILEKSDGVGGTWRDNSYPGCRVDTPNHMYSYTFAADHDWPSHYCDRATLGTYFDGVADRFGLREHIRLNAQVESARWDEDAACWSVRLASGETLTARALISAVGQLNRPKTPDIPGIERFAGPAFHSARWNHDVELAGKRVTVIGTGASATQFVPEIVDAVSHLTILQRSPPWLVPTPEYVEDLSADERWLMRHWPAYVEWYRMWMIRLHAVDGVLPLLYKEVEFGGEGAVSQGNQAIRDLWEDYLREQAQGDEALFHRLVPDYPPCGKRPLRDNGSWIRTLRRDDVELVCDRTEAVEPQGVRLADGRLIEADVLIYGTGFEADRFFAPLDIVGRDGRRMADEMRDPRAYRGAAVPGFPNFFSIYGPNTNTVVGAGIVFFSECTMRYIMGCLNYLARDGRDSMDVCREPFELYNEWVDARNLATAWGAPGVDSWYKNAAGRVTQNWPGTHHEFWEMTLRPEPEHFDVR